MLRRCAYIPERGSGDVTSEHGDCIHLRGEDDKSSEPGDPFAGRNRPHDSAFLIERHKPQYH